MDITTQMGLLCRVLSTQAIWLISSRSLLREMKWLNGAELVMRLHHMTEIQRIGTESFSIGGILINTYLCHRSRSPPSPQSLNR